MFRERWQPILLKIVVMLFMTLNSVSAWSENPTSSTAEKTAKVAVSGIGAVAENLLIPVTVASSFLSGIAVILGVSCVFSAFLRYMQHRINPLAQPMSMVVTLAILGILLLLLPFIYKLTESGVPPTLGGAS
jgi:uncharacterized membrane protein